MKPLIAVDGAGGDARCVLGAAEGGDEGDALTLGERRDAGLRAVADPPLRDVDDAAQVDRVGGVGQHAQVGQGVLDLAALVEPGPPDDLVGQADPHEHLLEGAGLGVRAVEHRDVAGPHAGVVAEPVDGARDEGRLVVLVVAHVADDARPVAGVAPQVLLAPALVAGDDGVGGAQDRLRRPVVLLEEDGARVGVVLLELLDVADRRTAEGVDRLVGVTDDDQLARLHPVLACGSRPSRRARAPAGTARGWCPGTRRP